jgi:ATP-dependent DNA helicase RecQ
LMPTGGGNHVSRFQPWWTMVFVCNFAIGCINERPSSTKRNIKAIALTGGIRSEEMIDLLDNCHSEIINFFIYHQNVYNQTGF